MKKYYQCLNSVCITIVFLLSGATVNGQTANLATTPTKQYNEIGSSSDYRSVRDSIEVLAYELYLIYQQYPDYSYKHQHDAQGRITGVTVTGINSPTVASRAASHLMKIEALGEAIRRMDQSYLPPSAMGSNHGRLTEKEARRYVPALKVPTEKRVIQTASPVSL
ncbi:MAG TPA: hypothetical protein VD816_16755 [Ohtaekwangia sp.]|nr:hypothetical protein [Ohtaekwangia sp.]